MDDSSSGERRSGRVVGKVIKRGEGGSESASAEKPLLRPPPRAGVLNAEEYEAHTEAKRIILDAQRRADEIKAEAIRYKEEVFAKAKEEARADVQARQAEEIARAKMEAGQIIANVEKDVIELALQVANRILGRDLQREPELVLEICANAIEVARASKAMTFRVNPEDGKLLREKRPRLMELIGRQVDLAIRDDSEVERGGCVIQTDYGTIDAQIRTQFEMLRTLLMPDTAKKEVK